MVPPGVFLQELHEPSISRALAKASKPAESSETQEESPATQEESSEQPAESPASPDELAKTPDDSASIMAVDSDWRTRFRVYLETGDVRDASTSPGRYMSQQDNFRPYLSPGRSLRGG